MKGASHDDPDASPMSVRGQSRKPLQAAVLGAVAALAFTGDMIVHRAREESTAASRTVVQQHRIDSERASTTATATQPLTLYLVGSDEDAGRVRSALAAITDTDGQPIGTSVQVLPVGTAGSTTLTVAPPGGGPPDSQRWPVRHGFGVRRTRADVPFDAATPHHCTAEHVARFCVALYDLRPLPGFEERFRKGVDMEEHHIEASPRVLSRIGGVLYLIIIVGGLFGEAFIRSRLIVPDDAAATAANIRSMESLWRFGVAAEFVMLACTVSLVLIFFVLLRPVSRELALLAVFFNLVSIAIEAVNEQQLLAALSPLGNAEYLRVFEPEQLYAMTSLSLTSYGYGFGVSLIFFGCECIVLGYLIVKSGYLPKAVGVLMQIAGLCYLTNSFALLLAPDFASRIFPAILIPAFVGEASLCLWLLLKGVNVHKWKPQARAQSTRSAATTV